MMFFDISLDCVVSHRPRCGTLVRLPRPLSLMFPYSRRVKIVLRRSLYGIVSDGPVLALLVPLLSAVWTGFPQGANISLEAGYGRIVFLSAVFVAFHSPNQGTLIPVPPSISPMGLQGLYLDTMFLRSKCWNLPRPIHPMWNRGPQ